MKLYLFLCTTLAITNRGFTRYVEFLNSSGNLNSMENMITPNTQSTLTSNTESTSNTTENIVTTNIEINLSPTENAVKLNFENISTPTTTELECPENRMFSPWRPMAIRLKCYCEYPFLPLPINDTCFELFRQGPCEPENFLVQPLSIEGNLPLPRCARNPCLEDGLVLYNATCHNIITHRICEDGNLYFREATSELKCRWLVRPRTSIAAPLRNLCAAGSRVDRNGRCRKML